ncbi:ribokinase [Marivivens donghaensis]|uniref:ribokinase n=1 Tax=Marivivens donghaensis TaxID=1699413 RepID=UPI00201F0CE1|nr:ribokinase [Marivivens donghaensis]MCL7409318.1 ribokinase [Marivivens donghaensis]MDN3702796.1 ribokinase [Marivivens donghaensis]
MAVWNLGSINTDIVYSMPHIPAPGETLASLSRQVFLGGKGANMSVAAARAGSHVRHIGAVTADSLWTRDRLMEYGVDTRFIQEVDADPAQAIIMVDAEGENAIILHQGANIAIPDDLIRGALSEAQVGDWIVTQNETNGQADALALGREMGLRVAYASAPFSAEAVEAVLPYLDFLILNEIEMAQLRDALGKDAEDLGVASVIITMGSKGAVLIEGGARTEFPAIKVEPVDTTGAGDTFTGYVLAGLDRGMPMAQAIQQATKAGALMVTRKGTADVIPDLAEVQAFRP